MSPTRRGDIVGKDESSKPGPGMYEPTDQKSKRAATITGKPVDRIKNDAPGPGTYNEDQFAVRDKTPSYKMSPAKRSELVSPD